MKYLSFILFFLPVGLGAQITLTQENVPAPGDTIFFARDTTTTAVNIGNAGADQTWDFSQLQADEYFQFIASDTFMDPDVENYPDANLIVTTDQVKTFIQSSDTAVYNLGGGAPEVAVLGLEVVRFEPPQKLYQFPSTYGTSFTNTYVIDATVDGTTFFPTADSVRFVRRATVNATIDAYGTVKTPFNNYEALRQQIETESVDSAFAKVFGNWVNVYTNSSVSVQYQWLSAEAKGNTVSVTLDGATGAVTSIEFFLDVDNASAPVASFTYEDKGEGTFAFTDQSTNAPGSWQWNFGDGGTSDAQSPEYTYAVAGEYQVCLTVTNVVGSNQVCQTITVDLVNAAPNPEFEIQLSVYPNPTDHLVRIKPQGLEYHNFVFQLFNHQGQRIRERRFSGQLQLDVSDLPSGMYSYFLKTVEGKIERWSTGKLQVSH